MGGLLLKAGLQNTLETPKSVNDLACLTGIDAPAIARGHEREPPLRIHALSPRPKRGCGEHLSLLAEPPERLPRP